MIPDSTWLETFRIFAEHLNFTRAGARLGLSQPAVHAHVQRLGEALGVVLYERAGRELRLTEQGRRTLAFARRAHAQAVALRAELRGEIRATPVRLVAGEGVLLYVLGRAIAAHVAAGAPAPRLTASGAEAVRAAVATGAADIGVLPRAALRPGIDAVRMLRVGQAVVCPADHPLADQATVSLTDLSGLPLVAAPPGRPQRVALDAAFADAGARLQVRVEVSGWPLILHCAALGLGLAIVNDYCTPPAGFVRRPIEGLPTVELFAVRRSGAELSDNGLDLWDRLV